MRGPDSNYVNDYRSAIALHGGAAGGTSVGEAAVAAARLGDAEGAALMTMAGAAFVAAHEAVLQGAALAVLVLAAVVFVVLRGGAVRAGLHG